ncbi:MAG: OmpA family protein [Deltaproteobacteria bacterium]|nr:OmpA family protein [Deltaproteobacteria bacterium]
MHGIKLRYLLPLLVAGTASADPTSGVDVALFRPSYDTGGIFSIEGARLMPKRDLSFKFLLGYAKSPLDLTVPGIGTGSSSVLNYVAQFDMVFGMSLSDRIAIGMDVGGYSTGTGVGFGQRGRYASGGMITTPSTGLLALRPLTNIDPSATGVNDLNDSKAGPLDTRVGLKVGLMSTPNMALALVGSVFLPFGNDQMLLGDANLVYEPKLAYEWRPDRVHATRVVANGSVRIRQRSVLQSYDPAMQMTSDAKTILDVGSEAVAGVGGMYEVSPRAIVAGEVTGFIPLPDSLTYGSCTLYSGAKCSTLKSTDYASGAKHGDLTALATVGLLLRVSADLTANLMVGTGQGGERGDDFRVTTGLVWSPQPAGVAAPGRNDHDGDGIPDSVDACPDEPEDKDGFQDEDGCPDLDNDGDGIPDSKDQCPNEPEDKDGFQDDDGCPDRDNDNDGIPDAADKCPNEPEDKDGFEDDDGCPDQDNDGDGFPDNVDKCPNDPETVNGFEDDDGCPDVRATTGPEERPDRIDLKGAPVAFDKTGKLTPAAKQLLTQVAQIIRTRKLTVRVEVHTALGTKATGAAAVTAQKKKDKAVAQKRAQVILDFFVSQGIPQAQIQAVAIGSDRPLGSANPADAINERVDFIKAQQGAP